MKQTKEEIIQKTLGLSVMDKEATAALDKLAGELTVKDMAIFQPIVEMTNEVADILNIKYVAEDKDSIQAFKDGKKTYGAFNTKLAEAKKELKEPYTGTIKAIDTIFGKFKEVYDLAKKHLEVEFKPHLDEQQRLKEEREAKKNAAREKEMADLRKQNEDILAKNQTSNIFNNIYYNVIEKYKSEQLASLNSLNIPTVERHLNNFKNPDLDSLIFYSNVGLNEGDFQILSLQKQEELNNHLNKVYATLTESYRTRLAELVQLENARMQSGSILEQPEVPHVPQTPLPPNNIEENTFVDSDTEMNTVDFIKRKVNQISDIRDECNYYFENFDLEDKNTAKEIAIMLTRALEFINTKIK